ncbi:MAG: peroxiredoxin [Candidatus Caldatribacterium sp.]|uniref:peroxiredoxin n=1 Tax=Candidatus Caldatribacterium sp. TaxID=2282143 RepID=UPI002991D0EC|nr:peroxiredoxin [Candidatus Caldatribacterium sp.]MCX7730629.1 peroxiredoxin [Candidatus Caldatribacterium sp.]MDW8081130.1 peroxiredoxin [Candidatus Calescibacterium sp.]
MLEVGTKAPDFVLKDQHGKEQRLSDFRGKKVILSFHPLAFTRVCTYQMQDLEAKKKEFDELGAIAFGLSVDPVPAKHAWAKEIGVRETLLLSDFWPHGEVAQKYGVFDEKEGFSKRAVFIVDEDGTILWKKEYPLKERPDIEEILAVLKG